MLTGMSKKEKEEELKLQVKRLESKYSALQVVPIISKIGQDQQGDIAAEGRFTVYHSKCTCLTLRLIIKHFKPWLKCFSLV